MGVIHRDIKPENILIHNETIKIGDFGFSRFVEGDPNQPRDMTKVCTPAYGPPQVMTGEHYSAKFDVWSVGAILYELLFNGLKLFPVENLIKLYSHFQIFMARFE